MSVKPLESIVNKGGSEHFEVFTKLRYKIVTKIDFCKQIKVCKQPILTGFCRKTSLFTNISDPNFCNRSCQHLQSD